MFKIITVATIIGGTYYALKAYSKLSSDSKKLLNNAVVYAPEPGDPTFLNRLMEAERINGERETTRMQDDRAFLGNPILTSGHRATQESIYRDYEIRDTNMRTLRTGYDNFNYYYPRPSDIGYLS